MTRKPLRAMAAAAIVAALPSAASANILTRGPVADVLTIFQQQPVPREVVPFKDYAVDTHRGPLPRWLAARHISG